MSISQYLSRHAHRIDDAALPKGTWQTVVIVPCRNEGTGPAKLLHSLSAAARTLPRKVLAIFVVNGRHADPPEIEFSNLETLSLLYEFRAPSLDIHVIDHSTGSGLFPLGQGVGLARKLGCDFALALFAAGQINTPWVHTTDGDAHVSEDYFNLTTDREVGLSEQGHLGAYVHPFAHELDFTLPLEAEALRLYDGYLRYYTQGLQFAGSPYAFPTVGSTIAFHLERYALVRGFPRREAAEDFYFLSKMAQISRVALGKTGTVYLRQRSSDRVPFGTGKSISTISDGLRRGEPYLIQSPECFLILRDLISAFATLARYREPARFLDELTNKNGPVPAQVLESMGLGRAVQQAIETRATERAILRHLHTWFDGLKTFQFLKRLAGLRPSIDGSKVLRGDGRSLPQWDFHAETSADPRATLHRNHAMVLLDDVVGNA